MTHPGGVSAFKTPETVVNRHEDMRQPSESSIAGPGHPRIRPTSDLVVTERDGRVFSAPRSIQIDRNEIGGFGIGVARRGCPVTTRQQLSGAQLLTSCRKVAAGATGRPLLIGARRPQRQHEHRDASRQHHSRAQHRGWGYSRAAAIEA